MAAMGSTGVNALTSILAFAQPFVITALGGPKSTSLTG